MVFNVFRTKTGSHIHLRQLYLLYLAPSRISRVELICPQLGVAGYVMGEQEVVFASMEVSRHRQHRKTDKISTFISTMLSLISSFLLW